MTVKCHHATPYMVRGRWHTASCAGLLLLANAAAAAAASLLTAGRRRMEYWWNLSQQDAGLRRSDLWQAF